MQERIRAGPPNLRSEGSNHSMARWILGNGFCRPPAGRRAHGRRERADGFGFGRAQSATPVIPAFESPTTRSCPAAPVRPSPARLRCGRYARAACRAAVLRVLWPLALAASYPHPHRQRQLEKRSVENQTELAYRPSMPMLVKNELNLARAVWLFITMSRLRRTSATSLCAMAFTWACASSFPERVWLNFRPMIRSAVPKCRWG